MRQQKYRQLTLALALAGFAFAQTSGTDVSFDVVSIKPTSGGTQFPWCVGTRFTTSAPLDFLIRWAYDLGRPFVVGLPGWVSDLDQRYAIEGKAASPMSGENCKAMVRSMLAHEFGMITHREQRTMAAYALVVSKKGLKMRRPTGEDDIATIDVMRFLSDDGRLSAASMGRLASTLSGFDEIRAPVVDRTGLEGLYAFHLMFGSNSPNLPDLWTALEEQLGLKLEPIRAPIDILVVDHIDKPREN
jgi:uncharacterized protein (TIGR03435 family)